jgi:soluble lytic murein transglycosylase-like protein
VPRRSRSRRRVSPSASASVRWFNRAFWFGVLAFVAWFSIERVAVPVMAESGYRHVERHTTLLRSAADEFALNPSLLAGLVLAESSGRPDAESSAGALGLCQLMLPTARERARLLHLPEPSRSDLLTKPALNARLGASYLRWLLDRYQGAVEPALVAYNAGPGRLDDWIKESGDYPSWRSAHAGHSDVLAYAKKVQRYRDHFAARGVIAPIFDQPPAPPLLTSAPPTYGPSFETSQDAASTFAPTDAVLARDR